MADSVRLDVIRPGHKALVMSFTGGGELTKRLSEMGLTKGSIVEVERIAPLGDPMDIKVRGYRLSLRKDEAAGIVVQRM